MKSRTILILIIIVVLIIIIYYYHKHKSKYQSPNDIYNNFNRISFYANTMRSNFINRYISNLNKYSKYIYLIYNKDKVTFMTKYFVQSMIKISKLSNEAILLLKQNKNALHPYYELNNLIQYILKQVNKINMDLYFNRSKIANIPINVRNELMLNLNFVDTSITWMSKNISGMRDYIYHNIISK